MKKIITLLLIIFFSLSLYSQSDEFEISKNMEIYTSIYKALFQNYVDELHPSTLMRTGIDSMLESLDPYTVYKSESEIEDFKYMTTGQYGGIGALIQQRGKNVYISEPYKDFPADKAGLISGDKILKIDSKDVEGKTSSEVSELMKGEPGTTFEITIERYGVDKPIVKQLIREKVSIPPISYSEVNSDSIGYIYLSGFTTSAGKDFRDTFIKMRKSCPLKGLIIDLRGNGGGLLQEAVNIMSIFVPANEQIVSTKGRIAKKNQTYKTMGHPLDTTIPVVVLVNGGSASASEILSGSMQDLDRGVIVGQRTYGKGLVQNIVPIAYNSQMKITVAKYYIPSGRCIQAIDYSHKDKNGNWTKIPDSLMTKFYTKNNRIVWDGAGIQPDVEIAPKDPGEITTSLYVNFQISNFATKYYLEHQNDSINPYTFEITETIWNDFLNYLKDKDYKYETSTEIQLNKFIEIAKESNYFSSIKDEIDSLSNEINKAKTKDFNIHKNDIKYLLGLEIITRYKYQEGKIIFSLKDDDIYNKAIEIINDKNKYNSILSPQ